ncbi:NAD(P)/FAD-dependent oxidoreductase [Marinicella rhabdoformis]|uniref:NAD(P)/FAD-dependent oxidoreductase n=1 Tax=Marinicella rhabdoformis TaxID=2580566 RepID=UPI0012AEC819|nr:FAD-dependent oxidoreductase [Marinicella rhabdoformis]
MSTTGKQQFNAQKVVVVGGGVIGIATAHYLIQKGFEVTVIEQKSVGSGSSFGNCGYICPSHMLPLAEPGMVKKGLVSLFNSQAPFKIKPQFRMALYRWLFQFAKRCNHNDMMEGGRHLKAILDDSRQEYESLLSNGSFEAQWKKSGLCYVMQSEGGLKTFASFSQLLSEHFNTKAQYIPGDDLPAFDPALKSGLAGGFHFQNDASLSPHELVHNWSKNLIESGLNVIENCRLTQVNKAGNRINSILTSQGEMVADYFVFATGAWSSHLASTLGCHIPVEPCKGFSVTVDRPEVCPQVPMLFTEHGVGVTPFDKTLRLGSMIEFSGFDSRIPKPRIDQLFNSASPYLRSNLSRKHEQAWCGWRPMTWDSLPIIGYVPGMKNSLLATGHNMLGMTLAPATGKMVASLVAGESTDIDSSPYSAGRF